MTTAGTFLSVYLCCIILLLSVQHMGVGPMAVNATAARIVQTLQSFYQANRDHAHVTEMLVMNISNQIFILTGQPLSHEAQHHWYNQLQVMHLENR